MGTGGERLQGPSIRPPAMETARDLGFRHPSGAGRATRRVEQGTAELRRTVQARVQQSRRDEPKSARGGATASRASEAQPRFGRPWANVFSCRWAPIVPGVRTGW